MSAREPNRSFLWRIGHFMTTGGYSLLERKKEPMNLGPDIDFLSYRLARLERLVAMTNLDGPDPTAAPEACHEFVTLLAELRAEVLPYDECRTKTAAEPECAHGWPSVPGMSDHTCIEPKGHHSPHRCGCGVTS